MTIPTTGKRDQNENEKKNDRSRLVYADCNVSVCMVTNTYEVLEWIVHIRTAENVDNQFSLPSPGR